MKTLTPKQKIQKKLAILEFKIHQIRTAVNMRIRYSPVSLQLMHEQLTNTAPELLLSRPE